MVTRKERYNKFRWCSGNTWAHSPEQERANTGFTTTVSTRCTRADQGHIPLFSLTDRYRGFGWLNDCKGATRSNVGTWSVAGAHFENGVSRKQTLRR
ncbi:MAG: hypothetical protein WBI05_02865 [Rhodoferax sp.]